MKVFAHFFYALLILAASQSMAFVTQTSIASSYSRREHERSTTTTTTLSMANFHLNPEETAFVWIEYQNEFAAEGGKLHTAVKEVMLQTNMLENSSRLADFARSSGCTIIHAPISFDRGHKEIAENTYGILADVKEGGAFTAGEWGADFVENMRPKQGDLIVKGKSGLCAFASTNLDFLLRQKRSKNVVLGGFLTNCCVESTMRSAYELGYHVYTLKDCVAAVSQEAQDATLQHNFGMFSVTTTSEEMMQAL